MNRCGDCKHWGTDRETGEAYRECQAVPMDANAWGSPPTRVSDQTVKAGLKAVVMDGSGYYAGLRCREDFGCVLFEPREGGGR